MVENSLGRLWIENTGDESLEQEFKYFIKDNIEINVCASPMLPENISFIDIKTTSLIQCHYRHNCKKVA